MMARAAKSSDQTNSSNGFDPSSAARAALRETLKPGDTVYTILRHVSRSGMSRIIDLYAKTSTGMAWIGIRAAEAMGDRYHERKQGIVVGGCGMDMGFALVYNLGYALYPEGFATERGRNGDTSGWDKDGGYALRHQWL